MWQSPNQRIRAMKENQRRLQERLNRPIHIKRVMAELRLVGTLGEETFKAQCRLLLNDITPDGTYLYSTESLPVGLDAQLTFEQPKLAFVHGRITACRAYNVESHVISEQHYKYRVTFNFHFKTEEEREAFRAFCEELKNEQIYGPKKKKAA
jgi:hypothetical protein